MVHPQKTTCSLPLPSLLFIDPSKASCSLAKLLSIVYNESSERTLLFYIIQSLFLYCFSYHLFKSHSPIYPVLISFMMAFPKLAVVFTKPLLFVMSVLFAQSLSDVYDGHSKADCFVYHASSFCCLLISFRSVFQNSFVKIANANTEQNS